MTRSIHRPIIILTLLFTGIFFVVSHAIADGVETIFITDEIDISAFPEVNLTFRAVDSNNDVPDILTNDDIVVYENGQVISDPVIGEPVEGPVHVIFVIDMGRWANFNSNMEATIRDSMLRFTDGYFRESVDTVAIMARMVNDGTDETVILLEPTQSASRFSSAVSALNFRLTEETQGLLGVESALSRLSELVEPGTGGTAVVYISRSIEWPQQSLALRDARTLGADSREQFAKIYSFHTGADLGEPLQTLASQSGGAYLQLSTAHDNRDSLNPVYQDIMAQGTRFSLSYRTQSGDSGPRTVMIAPSGTPIALAINAQSYNVSLQPAVVEIRKPEDNATFTRKAISTGENTWDYDLDSIVVTAVLSFWPDGFARDVKSASFFIGSNPNPIHTMENPADDTFNFNLDISEYEEPETVNIHVQVQDELGIKAESESININIAIKRDETVTIVVQPTPTPAPPIVINEDPCVQNVVSVACALKYAPWGIVLILGIVIIAYRHKVVSLAGAAGGVAMEKVAEVRKTILGGGGFRGKKVLAKLQVIVARRDLEGNEVKIHTDRTTIGRNPKLCDVLLYDEDEVSSVSGQHCTIQYDRGRFFITDDNSANGTQINGELLPPNRPRELHEGDEIVLGDLFHRGAKLRFKIVDSEPEEGQAVEGNVTLLDMDFSEPAPTESAPAFEGSKTILDMDDVDHADAGRGTLFGVGDESDDLPSGEQEDTDWLSDLE